MCGRVLVVRSRRERVKIKKRPNVYRDLCRSLVYRDEKPTETMEGSALLYRGFFVCERKSVSARRGCSVEEDPRNNAATKNRTGTVRLGGGRPKDGDEGESEGRTEEVAGATGEGGGKFWGRQVLSVPWLWLRRWALVSAAAGGRPQDFFSLWGGARR